MQEQCTLYMLTRSDIPGWSNVHVYTDGCEHPASLSTSLPHAVYLPEEGEYSILSPHDANLLGYWEFRVSTPSKVPWKENNVYVWSFASSRKFLLVPIPGEEAFTYKFKVFYQIIVVVLINNTSYRHRRTLIYH